MLLPGEEWCDILEVLCLYKVCELAETTWMMLSAYLMCITNSSGWKLVCYFQISLSFFFLPSVLSANTSLFGFLFNHIRLFLSSSLRRNTEIQYCWGREGCTNSFPVSFILLEIGSLYVLSCKTEPAWTYKGTCPQDGIKFESQRKFLLKLAFTSGFLISDCLQKNTVLLEIKESHYSPLLVTHE